MPIMADLPVAHPVVYPIDCEDSSSLCSFQQGLPVFRPYMVKTEHHHEKCWELIFRCLTTKYIHLDFIPSLDVDTFLLPALRRFMAFRGTPSELLSDQEKNFCGADRGLKEAFTAMELQIRDSLAKCLIKFIHFGGMWEREICSAKNAHQVVLGTEAVLEKVLLALERPFPEGILNAKPLGHVTSEIAEADPVTPSILLMGQWNALWTSVTKKNNCSIAK